MKKILLYSCISAVVILSSCQNKTKLLLAKKWDCVKVENLAPVNKNFLNHEDSLVTAQLETALQNLSWQFNTDNRYQCSTMGTVTAKGIYFISDDGKEIICTTTLNNNNRYAIITLTEMELVLSGYTSSVPVVLHFRAH
jgi:hypothetical protein